MILSSIISDYGFEVRDCLRWRDGLHGVLVLEIPVLSDKDACASQGLKLWVMRVENFLVHWDINCQDNAIRYLQWIYSTNDARRWVAGRVWWTTCLTRLRQSRQESITHCLPDILEWRTHFTAFYWDRTRTNQSPRWDTDDQPWRSCEQYGRNRSSRHQLVVLDFASYVYLGWKVDILLWVPFLKERRQCGYEPNSSTLTLSAFSVEEGTRVEELAYVL